MKWALPETDSYFAKALADDPRGFEIDHLNSALAHCKNFRTAVDGGAHVGTWSVGMAGRFQSVAAFEPAPDTFRCLLQNVGKLHNVVPFNLALGEDFGHVIIGDDPKRKGNTGSRHIMETGAHVEMRSLDGFGLDDVDFLKLDVEGYELFALKGAQATLQRCRPVVLIECKRFDPPRFGVDHEAGARWLEENGYREVERVRNDRIFIPRS
jgi:FkbM family methyltransferase